MSFSEKRIVVEIIEREDRALEHAGSDGVKRTYHPAKSMWLRLQQLQIAQQLAEPVGAEAQPTLCTSLHGVAHLDDQDLSIIGDATQVTRTVMISFSTRDISKADHFGLRGLQDDLGISFSDVALGTARLGFNSANDEMGEPDQWWLACHIPEVGFQSLLKAIADGQLGTVELGLALRHIYTAEGDRANAARQPHLFLRPNKSDSTIEWPEIATGFVTHLRMNLTVAHGPDIRGSEDDDATKSPIANAVNALAVTIGKLSSTIKWIGILITTLLLVVILKSW
jgi:phosphate:Na+ symporter